jgi:APA family basic amino acid/polyamine antiporter
MKGLFARKPLQLIMQEPDVEQYKLKRVLGPWGLISLGIGVVIGAGIFVLSGQAAAKYAGPAIVLSFILSAIGCALAGLCYAEFASMIPISGSAYTYSYATLGEFLAWIIGWDLVLEYLFGASTVAVGWSGYVVSFLKDFNINIPEAFFLFRNRRLAHNRRNPELSGHFYRRTHDDTSGYRHSRIGKG